MIWWIIGSGLICSTFHQTYTQAFWSLFCVAIPNLLNMHTRRHSCDDTWHMPHPFYFCSPSVPHIVTWGSESHFRHEHTRCHPPRPPHPLCCSGSLDMWRPLQQQVHVHDEEPEERPSTTIEVSLAHCLPRLSPFNETSKHRWWQTKTLLSEDASGVRKTLSPHPKLCMWVCTVFWKWLFCLELIYCMCRITKKNLFWEQNTPSYSFSPPVCLRWTQTFWTGHFFCTVLYCI